MGMNSSLSLLQQNVFGRLSSIKNAKILVVGDVGIDQYVTGGVKRISPEAPVPVVEVKDEFFRLGLSTNVAQNIKSLGGSPILLSVIGADDGGGQLQKLLQESEISTDFLITDKDRPTTRKIRVMSGMHHIVRVDYEEKKPLQSKLQLQILDQIKKHSDQFEGVILQDYAKGVLSKDLNLEITALCKKLKKPVFADPNERSPLLSYENVTLMTPNLKEAVALAKWDRDPEDLSDSEVHELGREIQSKIKSDYMIITRSKEGMTLFEDQRIIDVPTFARQVYDVTGAGDTVISALAMALISGFSLEEACIFANFAAGVVVAKVGSATCNLEEIRQSMNSY
ncbi:MAG: D-glycero-beta-D-manno-heptose-7-phosphate kinase [Bdellovibrionales bacterium]|nr:D-glycero-beta-D-manno-heptose-7-phosphate kinase [Bdellovibrionales bacterium]